MPNLADVLQGNDLSFLRMVAGAWGVELNAPDAYTAIPILVRALTSRLAIAEMVESLSGDAITALNAVMEHEGALSWAIFTRKYGEVRSLGAGKRDRDRPDLHPVSPAEVLWYRGLIGKAFLNRPPEPQEYAYIPEDLLEFMVPLQNNQPQPFGRPASPLEAAAPLLVNDQILDDACSLLAALRSRVPLDNLKTGIPVRILKQLLFGAALIDSSDLPIPENTRAFLEASRAEALAMLFQAWRRADLFNELGLLTGLVFEGDWHNDTLHTRDTVLDMLSQLPQDVWWSLPAFTTAVREKHPDFQRPAGDYDSWFIRSAVSGEYLRGFAHWDEVDGALLRFMLTGPLYWLGLYDLASPSRADDASAFRPSSWNEALWQGQIPQGFPAETARVTVLSDGTLRIPRLAPRTARYQITRFCDLENQTVEDYFYRLTPPALERARTQGLQITHLVNLLRKFAAPPLPPNLLQALSRWEKFGAQATLEEATLLHVSTPEVITALRKTKAARYLGEELNPTTLVVKAGGLAAVQSALVEIGYLAELDRPPSSKV